MTLHTYRCTTWETWRFGIGVHYSPVSKDDSVLEYDAYFDGECGITLFIGPFTLGVNLLWEHSGDE